MERNTTAPLRAGCQGLAVQHWRLLLRVLFGIAAHSLGAAWSEDRCITALTLKGTIWGWAARVRFSECRVSPSVTLLHRRGEGAQQSMLAAATDSCHAAAPCCMQHNAGLRAAVVCPPRCPSTGGLGLT